MFTTARTRSPATRHMTTTTTEQSTCPCTATGITIVRYVKQRYFTRATVQCKPHPSMDQSGSLADTRVGVGYRIGSCWCFAERHTGQTRTGEEAGRGIAAKQNPPPFLCLASSFVLHLSWALNLKGLELAIWIYKFLSSFTAVTILDWIWRATR